MTKPRRGKGKVALPIEWTERAVADLRAIDDYIAADNPAAAERWVGRLIAFEGHRLFPPGAAGAGDE